MSKLILVILLKDKLSLNFKYIRLESLLNVNHKGKFLLTSFLYFNE